MRAKAIFLQYSHTQTALLAFRIWSVDRQTKGAFTEVTAAGLHNNLALNPVVRIILESGIINAAYLLCYVLTLEYGTEGIEIMSEIVSHTFSLRAGLRAEDSAFLPCLVVMSAHGDRLLDRHLPRWTATPRRYLLHGAPAHHSALRPRTDGHGSYDGFSDRLSHNEERRGRWICTALVPHARPRLGRAQAGGNRIATGGALNIIIAMASV